MRLVLPRACVGACVRVCVRVCVRACGLDRHIAWLSETTSHVIESRRRMCDVIGSRRCDVIETKRRTCHIIETKRHACHVVGVHVARVTSRVTS